MLDIILFIFFVIILIGIGKGFIAVIQLKAGYAKDITFIHIDGIPNFDKGNEINLSFTPDEIKIGDSFKISIDNVIGMDVTKTKENGIGYLLKIHFIGKDNQEKKEIFLRVKSYNAGASVIEISKQVNKRKNYIPHEQQIVEL
ncbi:hypothetical protein SDC9_15168 [bioreactor metagenome]|uniref:Uncharacterized protein n=1 Tax=bioreactor metagenome TaxID=1076179 RepID=A0A644TR12_9ZZZZ|nr:hypothetical protein [Desulfitobacterium hafniense]MEA5023920.1 hypothetical protein [Desulfitobacterium hafniense]